MSFLRNVRFSNIIIVTRIPNKQRNKVKLCNTIAVCSYINSLVLSSSPSHVAVSAVDIDVHDLPQFGISRVYKHLRSSSQPGCYTFVYFDSSTVLASVPFGFSLTLIITLGAYCCDEIQCRWNCRTVRHSAVRVCLV